MGRKTEENKKNAYLQSRNKTGLTRDQAAELLHISSAKLARIELDKIIPDTYTVASMQELYADPTIGNYFCANDCMVGKVCGVHELKEVSLSEAALGILSSVNEFTKWKDKFIDIAKDGCVDSDEREEFKAIVRSLSEIEAMIERLRLYVGRLKFPQERNG